MMADYAHVARVWWTPQWRQATAVTYSAV